MIQVPVNPPITEYLYSKASRLHIPLSGTFEITPVCNMNCRMCYVRMSKQQQESISPLHSAKEWLELAQKAKDQGMLYLLVTGGEPFIHPEIKEILTGLNKMGLIVSINSNATMITEEVVEWLKEVPPFRINITLYGASDETYARLCRNPKGFTQTMHAIHLLKEAGIMVRINCSMTPYNKDDIEKIFEICKEENLMVQATSYMFPPMRKDESMIGFNDRFTPEEAAYYAAKIEYFLNGKEWILEKYKHKAWDTGMCGTDMQCLEAEGDCVRCRAGKASFWVTWQGEMYPCGMIVSHTLNNVFKEDFAESWKKVVEYTSKIRLPKECKQCDLKNTCRACAAMVLTETGTYDQVPTYRCEMTQAYESQFKKLVQELLAKDKKSDGE